MRIVIYGDSLTWGADVSVAGKQRSNDKRYGKRIEALLPEHEVIVDGVPGRAFQETDDHMSAFRDAARVANQNRPTDLMVIWLGTNDLFRPMVKSFDDVKKNVELFIKEYENVIVKLWDQGYKPSITPPQYLFVTPADLDGVSVPEWALHNRDIVKVFDDLGYDYVNLFDEIKMNREEGDGVHLTDEQENQVFELVYKAVKEKIKKMGK